MILFLEIPTAPAIKQCGDSFVANVHLESPASHEKPFNLQESRQSQLPALCGG